MDRNRTPPLENAPIDPSLTAQLDQWSTKASRLDGEAAALQRRRADIDRMKSDVQAAHRTVNHKTEELRAARIRLQELQSRREAQRDRLQHRKGVLRDLTAAVHAEVAEFEQYQSKVLEAERRAHTSTEQECQSLARQCEALRTVVAEKTREASRLREEKATLERERGAVHATAARIGALRDDIQREQIRRGGMQERLAMVAAESESAHAVVAELKEKLTVVQKQRAAQDAAASAHGVFLQDLSEVLESASVAADRVTAIEDMRWNLQTVLQVLAGLDEEDDEQDEKKDTEMEEHDDHNTKAIAPLVTSTRTLPPFKEPCHTDSFVVMSCVPLQRHKRGRSALVDMTNGIGA